MRYRHDQQLSWRTAAPGWFLRSGACPPPDRRNIKDIHTRSKSDRLISTNPSVSFGALLCLSTALLKHAISITICVSHFPGRLEYCL
ncbi:hypothetical protein EJ03DRAFT_173022 [Teratosphaeria nubilosa]|uniref:Uncharacterized protein n=1 Tax=Teratosphaeria nubilosa TaxID=161662 RepID=A0A6G1LJV9_9PEZI|nr:hypothetical protein EJ03DRAFT_173022 [Teratosphaeria nubilosa]